MILKKQDTKLLPITVPNINQFQNIWNFNIKIFSLTDSLVNLQQTHLNTPPHLKYVATLPCEIWMSENCDNLKYALWLMINHKIAQPSCDRLLHYKFITQFAGETIFEIGEHLAKLQAKWLFMSYAPFTLDFCPQRCRTRWISKITCVLQVKPLLIVLVLIGRLMWVYYQQISNCVRPVLTYRLTPAVTDRLLSMYCILLRRLFLCYNSYVQSIMGFYMAGVNIFFLVN